MLDDDALDHIGCVLAGIYCLLAQRENVLPLDDFDGLLPVLEQLGHGPARDPVSLVLEPMDFDPVLLEVLEPAELAERSSQLLALPHDDLGLLHGNGRRAVDAVQDAGVRHFLDKVEDVVQAADQRVDVFAVERCDKGRLQLVTDVVADLIAGVLCVAQLAGEPFALVVVAEELLEQPRRRQDVPRIIDEQIKEFLFARDERQAHRSLSCNG